MPGESVYNNYITQFSSMIHVKAQQMKSRLRPYTMERVIKGESAAYDGIGPVEARELVGRLNKTQFADIEHTRRQIPRRQFEVTLAIDKFDVEAKLTDPQGDYANAVLMAMERMYDRVCIESMFADVKTGKDFSGTVTFAADGGVTVDATAGYTLAKLLAILQTFADNEIGNDMPVDLVSGISGDEQTTLLQIAQLTSGDYSRQYSLEKGRIVNACGLNYILFGASVANPMLPVSGGVRTSFALATGGLCVGIGRDFGITIKDRADYVNVKQVQITGVMGACRTEGARIVKVTTTDL